MKVLVYGSGVIGCYQKPTAEAPGHIPGGFGNRGLGMHIVPVTKFQKPEE